MKVQGMVDPGSFTVERIPGSGRSLVRLFQNVTPVQTEDFTGYEYDEYHVEVETWDGIAANVRENYETFLRKGMDNEIDRSNRALYSAQVDTDAMNVDQEVRRSWIFKKGENCYVVPNFEAHDRERPDGGYRDEARYFLCRRQNQRERVSGTARDAESQSLSFPNLPALKEVG